MPECMLCFEQSWATCSPGRLLLYPGKKMTGFRFLAVHTHTHTHSVPAKKRQTNLKNHARCSLTVSLPALSLSLEATLASYGRSTALMQQLNQ